MLEKLKNLNKREKTGLVIAGLFLFLSALNYGLVNPVLSYLNKVESDIRIEQQKIKMSTSIIEQEGVVAGKFEEAKEKIAKASSDDEAIDEMKGNVDELAKKSGILVNAMDHRPAVMKGNMSIYTVEIGQFEADTKGLLQFLHEIRMAEGFMKVEKLIFAVDKEKGALKGSVLISKIVLKEAVAGEGQPSE